VGADGLGGHSEISVIRVATPQNSPKKTFVAPELEPLNLYTCMQFDLPHGRVEIGGTPYTYTERQMFNVNVYHL
jgi:hypothetical protein